MDLLRMHGHSGVDAPHDRRDTPEQDAAPRSTGGTGAALWKRPPAKPQTLRTDQHVVSHPQIRHAKEELHTAGTASGRMPRYADTEGGEVVFQALAPLSPPSPGSPRAGVKVSTVRGEAEVRGVDAVGYGRQDVAVVAVRLSMLHSVNYYRPLTPSCTRGVVAPFDGWFSECSVLWSRLPVCSSGL